MGYRIQGPDHLLSPTHRSWPALESKGGFLGKMSSGDFTWKGTNGVREKLRWAVGAGKRS